MGISQIAAFVPLLLNVLLTNFEVRRKRHSPKILTFAVAGISVAETVLY